VLFAAWGTIHRRCGAVVTAPLAAVPGRGTADNVPLTNADFNFVFLLLQLVHFANTAISQLGTQFSEESFFFGTCCTFLTAFLAAATTGRLIATVIAILTTSAERAAIRQTHRWNTYVLAFHLIAMLLDFFHFAFGLTTQPRRFAAAAARLSAACRFAVTTLGDD